MKNFVNAMIKFKFTLFLSIASLCGLLISTYLVCYIASFFTNNFQHVNFYYYFYREFIIGIIAAALTLTFHHLKKGEEK